MTRPGRPSLKHGERSVAVPFKLPKSERDALYQKARELSVIERRNVTVSELIRRGLARLEVVDDRNTVV